MNRFTLRLLEQVKGKIKFSVLEIDGVCEFEIFCTHLEEEGTWKKQISTIFSRLDQVANLQLLPQNKFKNVTPHSEKITEYEVKTPDLRVYLIKVDEGHIVVMAGKKNTQPSDFKRFRSIKKQYLASRS